MPKSKFKRYTIGSKIEYNKKLRNLVL